MREIRFKLSGIVLKTERELVLEKGSTMRISTKRKGVCRTHERRRERVIITGDIILYEEKIQEYLGGLRLALNRIGSE